MRSKVDYPTFRKLKIKSEMGQTCKACGRRDKFNFHVPDYIWRQVVPPGLVNLVICLDCFDEFADEAGIDYAPLISELYFVGNRAIVKYRAVASASD